MRSLRLPVVAGFVLMLATSAVQGQHRGHDEHPARLDKALRETTDANPRVIISYRPGAGARVKRRLAARGVVGREHVRLNTVAARVRKNDLPRLASDPDIQSVSLDAVVRNDPALTGGDGGAGTATGPGDSTATARASADNQTSGDTGDSTDAWSPYLDAQRLRDTLGLRSWHTGAGVGIAIVDSGIAPTADLANRITAFYDFTRGGIATAPYDDYGHGTHVAGLAAGDGAGSSGRYIGTAPRARLIGLKVLDAKGQGYTSDVLAAIEFAIANRTRLGIHVLNLSLGHPIFEPAATDPLVQAVERAVASGIVVVVSAGNFGRNPKTGEIGYAGITSPGNARSAVTVGAQVTKFTTTRDDDELAPYSSRGPTWYDG